MGRWSPLTASVPGVGFLSGTLLWLLVFGGLRLRRWQRAREITLGVWGGDLPLVPQDRRGVGGL
ncbi:MAG: hypothetical protein R3F62_18260 [Planctomycetota bacterium]